MKAALDMQVRMAQEAVARERDEDREWVRKEQERIALWNQEEQSKIEAQKLKEVTIRRQREQQLRELVALREREATEMRDYEINILRGIHKEIKVERAKEQVKKQTDAENMRKVKEMNVVYQQQLKVKKQEEHEAMRKLEATWTELLDKQERARDRQLKATYARQASSTAPPPPCKR